jgi:hypothetical protein
MSIKPVAIVTATLGMAVKAWIALAVFLFLWDMYQLKKEER